MRSYLEKRKTLISAAFYRETWACVPGFRHCLAEPITRGRPKQSALLLNPSSVLLTL
jgi:hypothetical protein